MYKATASLVRAYANIADDLDAAGYSADDIARIKRGADRYVKLRDLIRNAAGETLDIKAYEADMRFLIDRYIEADEPRKISPFDEMPLVELIVKTGISDAIAKRLSRLGGNQEAIAETIENNVRTTIIKKRLNDPVYFEKMSAMLDEVITARKNKAIEYEAYLQRIAALAEQVEQGYVDQTPAVLKGSPALRALFNTLTYGGTNFDRALREDGPVSDDDPSLLMAMQIDETVRTVRPDDWRDNGGPREQVIKAALFGVLQDEGEVERVFPVVKAQSEY